MTEHVKTGDTVCFTANFYHPISGFSCAADATPYWSVYKDVATTMMSGNIMTARTDVYGSYIGSFQATLENGFISNSFYDVQVSGTVGGIGGICSVKQFVVDDIYSANVIQVSGQYVSYRTTTNANVISVSGTLVSLDDFNKPTVTAIRQEMDANSLMLSAISGQAITAAEVRTEMDANSLRLVAISGSVAGLAGAAMRGTDSAVLATNFMAVSGVINTIAGDVVNLDGAAMRGTDNAALATNLIAVSGSILRANMVQVSGEYISDIIDVNVIQISGIPVGLLSEVRANVVQVSGIPVSPKSTYDSNIVSVSGTYVRIEDFRDNVSAANVRTEMDANSLMLTAISGQALTATAVRTEMDANSLSLTAISGSVAGLAGAAMRGTDGAALATNLMAVSGSIPTTTDIYNQASGALVSYNVAIETNIYFAHIKYISDSEESRDEFAVQWFKNDQPVSSGDLTAPAISVYNTSTGAAIFEHQSMNYASSRLGVVRYDYTTTLPSGEPYLVETSGTIDAINRTWKTIVGIDLL